MTGKPWVIVQHLDAEGPGLIATEMRRRGLDFRMVAVNRLETLPEAGTIGGLVSMGGPMGVYEAAQYPFLGAEMELMRALVGSGRPVLGVCLGAQLLAAALGATVVRGPAAEIGPGEVNLTEAGRADAVLAGSTETRTLPVLHWHQDTFNLPAGAIHLARSALYEAQAFRVGRNVYGLQFHIEVDSDLAAAWAPLLPAGLRLAEADVSRVAMAGRTVVARYFDLAAGGAAGAS